MKPLTLALTLAAAAALIVPAAQARQPRLHVHMTGKHVRGLQWMLKGNKPSRFTGLHTYKGKLNSRYDKRTRLAVKRMKYRLGYPKRLLNGRLAGPFFLGLLKGKRHRPVEWIGVAGQRAKQTVARAKPSGCATRILDAARSQIGVRETSTNYSATIANYQRITGAYHAAWCVSFAQWALVKAGIGPIADRTAGVNYAYNWALRRGWVRATPRAGAWVAFGYSHSTHMGIVESVNGDGSYTTIEGNHSDSVARVHRGRYENYPVFVHFPCLDVN